MIYTNQYSGQADTHTPCTACENNQGIFEECLRVPGGEWHGACGSCIRRGHATQCSARDINDNREGGSREKPKSPKTTRSGRVSKPGLYPGQRILGHPFA